jgi:hypothetical protein
MSAMPVNVRLMSVLYLPEMGEAFFSSSSLA